MIQTMGSRPLPQGLCPSVLFVERKQIALQEGLKPGDKIIIAEVKVKEKTYVPAIEMNFDFSYSENGQEYDG